MVFFHRFYSVHSFAEHDRFEVAVACLLLAAKTEECPKKLTTVIQESWRLKTLAAQKSGSNGLPSLSPMASVLSPTSNATTPLNGVDGDGDSNNNSSTDKDGYFDVTSEEFLKLKERILLLERVILHTIGFELSIDHPYKFLVEQIRKKLIPSRLVEYNSPPSPLPTAQKMIDDLVENGMKFANDSMHTSLCLQFHPKTIAMTCVYMSCRICDMKPTEGRTWLDILDIDTDSLASIALQIMELIASKRGCNLEIFVTIRSDLEKLRLDKRNPRKPGENEDSSGGRDAKKPRT
jgi:cyclin T